MKLTNYIRDAFLLSAMDDVPSVDYPQQIQDGVQKLAEKYRKDAGLKSVHLDRLNTDYLMVKAPKPSRCYVSHGVKGLHESERNSISNSPTLLSLIQLYDEQNTKRQALEDKLAGIAQGCTTRKQLVELLPEFEKYLPAEHAKTANLPVISNVVGEFIRAGWPKNKQATTAVAT